MPQEKSNPFLEFVDSLEQRDEDTIEDKGVTPTPKNPFLEFTDSLSPRGNQVTQQGINIPPVKAPDEEWEDLKYLQGSNNFWKLLESLNLAQHGMFGVAQGLLDDVTFDDILKDPYGTLQREAERGMKQKISGEDILKTAFGEGEWGSLSDVPLLGSVPGFREGDLGDISGKGAVGFGMDVFLDPTLFGIGKIARTAGVADKLFSRVEKVLPQGVGGKLGATQKESQVIDLVRDKVAAGTGKAARVKKTGREIEIAARVAAKKLNIPVETARRRIVKEAESIPDDVASALGKESIEVEADIITKTKEWLPKSPEHRIIAKEAVKIRGLMDDLLVREQNALLGTMKMDSVTISYIPHIITDGFRKIMKKNKDLKRLRSPGTHAYQLSRMWRDLRIDEINELGRKGLLPGYKGTKINQVFKTDAATTYVTRALASEKAIADVELLMDAAAKLGTKIGDEGVDIAMKSSPNVMRPLKYTGGAGADPRNKKLADELGKYIFDDDVAKHLDDYFDAVVGTTKAPTTMDKFLSIFDEVQANWKLTTLFVFPAYHARNVVGNIWNNTLAGVLPDSYATAIKFQKTSPRNHTARFVLGKGANRRDYSRTELDDLMLDYGVTNQFRYFIDDSVSAAGKKGGRLVERIPVVGHGVRAGLRTAEVLENNARIAHFIHQMNRGLTPMEAARSTKKYLFDYTALTGFEKSTMRRLMPFYSWTRKNLPLQIRGVIEKPMQYAALGDVIREIEKDAPLRGGPSAEENMFGLDWITNNTGIRTRITPEGHPSYFLLGGWVPAADLNKILDLPSGPFRAGIQEITPFAKVPFELFFNKDLFTGADIESYTGAFEKSKFAGVPMPKKLQHVLKNIRFISEAEKIMAASDKLGWTGGLSTKEGEDVPTWLKRFFFGVKSYPINPAQTRLNQAYRIREIKSDIRTAARRKGSLMSRRTNIQSLQRELEAVRKGKDRGILDRFGDYFR